MLTIKFSYKIIVFLFLLPILFVKCNKYEGYRTFAGEEIDIKDAPFTASISLGCAGALVKPQWVLSAAHCFLDKSVEGATVCLGATDKRKCDYKINVDKVYMHPEYKNIKDIKRLARNDLALLKLAEPAKLSQTVQVLELEDTAWPAGDKRECTLSGYGLNIYNNTKLHKSKFSITLGCDCIKNDILCTVTLETGDDSPCFGDSGGIMVCNNKGVGVTSHSMPLSLCQNEDAPPDGSGCGVKDTAFLSSYISLNSEWYTGIIQMESHSGCKANILTEKSILYFNIFTSLQLFALLIVFSPFFCY